jgi:hypothetical protein
MHRIRSLALGAAAAALSLFAANADAASLTRQPYLQRIGPDTATVAFRMNAACAPTVRYGPNGAPSQELRSSDSGRLQALVLTGLRPATEYTYVVDSCGSSTAPKRFTTAPVPGTRRVHFATMGDFGKGNESPPAWALREQALRAGRMEEVLSGLAGVDDDAAWEVRERGMRRELSAAVARSLTGLGSPRADALREELLARERLAVLRSIHGLDTPFARALRVALEDKAPKLVLRSVAGLTSDEAFALRERGAPRTKEAIDSLDGLDDERAWRLREAYVTRWPSTAVSSLMGLAFTARAEALMLRALEAGRGRLPVLRNAYRLLAAAQTRELPLPREPQPARTDDAPQTGL